MKFSTRVVHGGEPRPGGNFHPVSPPIYNSATFYYDRIAEIDRIAGGEQPGFMYGRYANPTNQVLEQAVAQLEEADTAWSFASGMAALHAAILAAAPAPGDVILCSRDVYGATIGLLLQVIQPAGIHIRLADLTRPELLDQELAASPHPVRLVIVETISNPLLRVLDVRAMAEKVHAAGAKLLVDATFSTPMLSRPLTQGADYVVHSATKYLAGHGDVMGGIVAARADEAGSLDMVRKLVGGMLGPHDAWLILRGLRTLALRMERQCANARRVAEFLAAHPQVGAVYFPGLRQHPDHVEACRQFPAGMFGAIVSFEVRMGDEPLPTEEVKQRIFGFVDRLKLCLPCTSLGDVQSLVQYPLIASHRSLSPKQRREAGIGEGLLRLSVGIEDADDIIEDLEQALQGMRK